MTEIQTTSTGTYIKYLGHNKSLTQICWTRVLRQSSRKIKLYSYYDIEYKIKRRIFT